MSNPLVDFLEEYEPATEKVAFSLGGFGKQVAEGAMSGVAATAAAAALAGTSYAATQVYNAATKARDFRSMMSLNPDLHEHHQRDPRMFNQMFSSLREMNPTFSKDPLVAGTYMRRMVENPLTAGGILTESISTRDKFPGHMDKAVDTGMSAAAKRTSMHVSPAAPDPLSALRQQHEQKKMESDMLKFRGAQDNERLMQQRRDQIRKLRGLGP
jgi:hypothetical protein